MRKAGIHKYIRKWHRYLGVLFGVQFLFWTLGGLYFSWTDIKKIRGEHVRKEEPPLVITDSLVSPYPIIGEIKKTDTIQKLKTVQLADILGRLYYQVSFHNGRRVKTILADARTGRLRPPLNEQEAIAVAKSRLKIPAEPESVKFLEETGSHHEYREKPLPAYGVVFKGKINSTVYVSAETGTVQSFRNNQWRLFDFLWMLHTMDYRGRDNFNNWLLRIFSVLGLVTIISGFILFPFVFRRKKKFE